MANVTFHAKMFFNEKNFYKKYFNAMPAFHSEESTCEYFLWTVKPDYRYKINAIAVINLTS